MPLLGEGVLAIWNGIANRKDADFLEWHIREHMPERIGLPGFLRGRRYVSVDGTPTYFNFYEVEDPGVLASRSYVARLNDPTEWTRAIVANFCDTARTACRVVASFGHGIGCFIDVMRFDVFDEAATEGAIALVAELAETRAISGAHLLRREGVDVQQETAEARLRGGIDRSHNAIIILESPNEDGLQHARRDGADNKGLMRAGLAEPAGRGLYRFQFGLDERELRPTWSSDGPSNTKRILA